MNYYRKALTTMKSEKQSLVEFATKTLNRECYLQLNQEAHMTLHMHEPLSIEQSKHMRHYLCVILTASKMLAQAAAIPDPPVTKSFWNRRK